MNTPTTEPLDFEIVEEHWNEYHLENGRVLLRVRNSAVRFGLVSNDTQEMRGATLVTATADAALRGKPNDPRPPRTVPVEFEAIREPFNVYRLRGPDPRIIRARTIVTGVRRVLDAYDGNGEPRYEVDYQTALSKPVPDTRSVRA